MLFWIFLFPVTLIPFRYAHGQIGCVTRKDFGIQGPVRLYKQTVYKDFHQKFEKYEAGSVEISAWYLSDKEGKILFEQLPEGNSGFYNRYLHSYKNNRYYIGLTTVIDKDGTSLLDGKYDGYWMYKYPDNHTLKRYDCDDNELMETKRYNDQNLLIDKSYRLGSKKYGYRDTWKYDKNEKVIEENHYNAEGVLKKKQIWKRDATGNTLAYFEYDSTGNLLERAEYEYNSTGKETKCVWYNADNSVNWGRESKYMQDTLLVEYIVYNTVNKFPEYYVKRKYDENNRLRRIDYFVWEKMLQKGRYDICSYDENGNITTRLYYDKNKLYEKSVRSDYVGDIFQKSVRESFDENGGLKAVQIWKNDKYGNEISYENYKIETKFGEKVKTPVEKRETKITYYGDDVPAAKLNLSIERKKKEDWLNIDVKNIKGYSSSVTFYFKPTVTGSGKNYIRNSGPQASFQYDFVKRMCHPYFIVKSGDEIYVSPLPDKEDIAKKPGKISVKNVKKIFRK